MVELTQKILTLNNFNVFSRNFKEKSCWLINEDTDFSIYHKDGGAYKIYFDCTYCFDITYVEELISLLRLTKNDLIVNNFKLD